MRLNNFKVVTYTDNDGKIDQGVYYGDPDMDLNSAEVREEYGIPYNVDLTEIPQCEWPVWAIKEIMDSFFDDACKSGTWYEPSGFENVFQNLSIPDEKIRQGMFGLLKLVEDQFGY